MIDSLNKNITIFLPSIIYIIFNSLVLDNVLNWFKMVLELFSKLTKVFGIIIIFVKNIITVEVPSIFLFFLGKKIKKY